MTCRLAEMSRSFNQSWKVYLTVQNPIIRESFRRMLLLGIYVYVNSFHTAKQFGRLTD